MGEDRKKLIEKTIENIYAIKHKIMYKMVFFFKEIGITHSQMAVLRILQKSGNINIKDIAGHLGITSSATTQIVDELVKKEFLLRKRNADDRRTVNLTLSEKAMIQFDSIKNKSFNELYSLFAVLSDEELLDYCKLSSKIIGNKSEGSQPGKENMHV
ncbi:MAG: MarR family winged helix-turn-helix transcriptional regulator [Candidatus Humimicrobiaceae bacterium]